MVCFIDDIVRFVANRIAGRLIATKPEIAAFFCVAYQKIKV